MCVLQCNEAKGTSAETKCYTYTKHIKQSANGGFSFYCVLYSHDKGKQEDTCRTIKLCFTRFKEKALSIFLNFLLEQFKILTKILKRTSSPFVCCFTSVDVYSMCALYDCFYDLDCQKISLFDKIKLSYSHLIF